MQPSLHLSHSGSWEAGPEKLILSRQDIVPLAMETACSRAFLSSPWYTHLLQSHLFWAASELCCHQLRENKHSYAVLVNFKPVKSDYWILASLIYGCCLNLKGKCQCFPLYNREKEWMGGKQKKKENHKSGVDESCPVLSFFFQLSL